MLTADTRKKFLSNRKNAFRAAWQNEYAYIAAKIRRNNNIRWWINACIVYVAIEAAVVPVMI